MIQQKAKETKIVLEWDDEHGNHESYTLPKKNALAIADQICERVASITLYNYEYLQNLREYHRNIASENVERVEPAMPARNNHDNTAAR